MRMNWLRMAEALALPMLLIGPLLWMCWSRGRLLSGIIAGSAIAFVGFIIFAGVEYAESVRFRIWCEASNTPCPPSVPSDFTRIVAYGSVAMVQVMAVFLAAQTFEKRLRDREFDPSWR
jgi:hypothetical protein